MTAVPTYTEALPLAVRARNIRRHALRMGQVQGQGYVGQALGAADLLAVAYFHALRLDPSNPEWEQRDRFYLSIGHYAIALYAALIEAGVIPEAELETYGSDDSRLPMSGMAAYTPGWRSPVARSATGWASPSALASGSNAKGSDSWVYNLLSDGELNEGSTWEAAMSASHWRLDNLIAIIDVNNQQADGHASEVLSFEPIVDRWQAFGWFVQRVDGNDLGALVDAFDQARAHSGAQPRVIICDTRMGKGVPFLENRDKTHFIRVDENEWDLALKALDAGSQA